MTASALLAGAAPALADDGQSGKLDDRFVLLGDTVVQRGETVNDLVVIDGDVSVAGPFVATSSRCVATS
ncbi:MAG: hypothetical protein EXQ70_01965 [Solirubrobacterales bacterium]|nr:hypothetical protein [Solirubrobacterales bacterium]